MNQSAPQGVPNRRPSVHRERASRDTSGLYLDQAESESPAAAQRVPAEEPETGLKMRLYKGTKKMRSAVQGVVAGTVFTTALGLGASDSTLASINARIPGPLKAVASALPLSGSDPVKPEDPQITAARAEAERLKGEVAAVTTSVSQQAALEAHNALSDADEALAAAREAHTAFVAVRSQNNLDHLEAEVAAVTSAAGVARAQANAAREHVTQNTDKDPLGGNPLPRNMTAAQDALHDAEEAEVAKKAAQALLAAAKAMGVDPTAEARQAAQEEAERENAARLAQFQARELAAAQALQQSREALTAGIAVIDTRLTVTPRAVGPETETWDDAKDRMVTEGRASLEVLRESMTVSPGTVQGVADGIAQLESRIQILEGLPALRNRVTDVGFLRDLTRFIVNVHRTAAERAALLTRVPTLEGAVGDDQSKIEALLNSIPVS